METNRISTCADSAGCCKLGDMIALVVIVAFLVVCALAPRYGVDSRFIDRPGRQL